MEVFTSMNPRALTGMTIGSAIMFLFGVVWFLVGFSGGRFVPVWLRAGLPVVGLALAPWIAMLAVRALCLNFMPAD
jgi:hypothetical protein